MNWKRIFFWREKVDVQDVFNRVIDAKFYSEFDRWMCLSLMDAQSAGFISKSEYRQAMREIGAFLSPRHSFLSWALTVNGLPNDFESRVAIYRNWKDRPKLK